MITQFRTHQQGTPFGLMDECDIEDCFGIPGALEKRAKLRDRERLALEKKERKP